MPLINCQINLSLTCSAEFAIVTLTVDNQIKTFVINDTKLFVCCGFISWRLCKIIAAIKKGFRRTINWNKYQSEPTLQGQNQYLNYLIDLSF